MDETYRDRVQIVQLLPTATPTHDEAGLLEQAEMLGHGDPRHVVSGGQGHQGLAVALEECVEQCPSSGIGKRSEHRFHQSTIGNQMVSCQGYYLRKVNGGWTSTCVRRPAGRDAADARRS